MQVNSRYNFIGTLFGMVDISRMKILQINKVRIICKSLGNPSGISLLLSCPL